MSSYKTRWLGTTITLDLLLTTAALLLAHLLRGYFPGEVYLDETLTFAFLDKPLHFPFFLLIPVIIFIWLAVFSALSLYDTDFFTGRHKQPIIIGITGATFTFAGVAYFIFPELSRFLFLYFYLLDLLFLLGWRKIAVWLLKTEAFQNRQPKHRLLIVGDGVMAQEIGTAVRAQRESGIELVGFINDSDEAMGTVGETAVFVQEHHIHEVIFAFPPGHQQLLQKLVYDLQPLPVNLRVVPDTADLIFVQAGIEEFIGIPMISLRQPAIAPLARLTKRLFDITVSGLLLLFSLPFLLPIIWLTHRQSPGPLLYKSQRMGEGGKLFPMLKFRTMVVGADETERELLQNGDEIGLEKRADDPRITKNGRFLRRTSIDEWPQLINVFKGEMSLVGPRPELPWLVEKYEAWQYQRFAVPQGMTGWWQVKNRDKQNEYNLRVEDDLYYIHNQSFLLDLRILWLTIGVMVRGDGAY